MATITSTPNYHISLSNATVQETPVMILEVIRNGSERVLSCTIINLETGHIVTNRGDQP